MNNACPGCGAVYSVQPQHVGRRLACKKCGVALAVDATGLHLADAEPTASPSTSVVELPPSASTSLDMDSSDVTPSRLAGSRPSRSSPFLPALVSRWGALRAAMDLSMLSFFAGVVLALLSTLLSSLATIQVRRATVVHRLHVEAETRRAQASLERAEESEADRQRARETWRSEERRLHGLMEDAQRSAVENASWTTLLLFAGLLLMGLGALGFLRENQPLTRRILGTIVLGVEGLGVFLIWLWRG